MSFLSNAWRIQPLGSRQSGQSSTRVLVVLSLLALFAVGLGVWLPSGHEAAVTPQVAVQAPASSPTAATTPPTSAAANPTVVARLYPAPTVVEGQPLPKASAVHLVSNAPAVGRSAQLDRAAFAKLTALHENDTVELPLLDGTVARGTVNIARHDEGGWWRVGGVLEAPRSGSFALGTDGRTAGGLIQFQRENLAYEITEDTASAALVLRERRRSDVVCAPLPRPDFEPEVPPAAAARSPQEAPPILSSRPTATAIIFLDFDGADVIDPLWNNGKLIHALPSTASTGEINTIWARVKEDFWPFNIDVTTDPSRYDSAQPKQRMRCIITPTNTAAPGAGGVAYVNSFSQAGNGTFSSDIPCWVFNSSVIGISEAISHEIGHTLGLRHDGRTSPAEEYYLGHGSGDTGWCPIMGAGYYESLVQWSKGEYLNANNQEDDLAIITKAANGFTYVADEAGDTIETAAALGVTGTDVSQQGIITKATDTDVYLFVTAAGPADISVNPAALSPNLDILFELLDETGAVVASDNQTEFLPARITRASLPGGVYYLRVRGTGKGDPLGTGYTSYGSIGAYTISGTIPGGTPEPTFTSSGTASGEVGLPFSYKLKASSNPSSYDLIGTLPGGLNFDAGTALISGTPTESGDFTLTMSATNNAGTGTKSLTISILPPQPPTITSATVVKGTMNLTFRYQIVATRNPFEYGLTGTLPTGLHFDSATGVLSGTPSQAGEFPLLMSATNNIGKTEVQLNLTIVGGVVSLPVALDYNVQPQSSGTATWLGETAITFDGVDAAQSASIGDSTSSKMVAASIQGPATVSFYYRVDSQQGSDFLKFSVDGVQNLNVSGFVDWTRLSTTIPAGSHTLAWEYQKDASGSAGTDAAWVDKLIIATSPPPVISSAGFAPARTGVVFTYQITASNNPTSYSLTGTLPQGLAFNTALGRITGNPTEGGVFSLTLGASNAAGTGTKDLKISVESGPLDLAAVLDLDSLTWSDTGSAPWTGETSVTHDAVDAAAALGVGDNEFAAMETDVTGPASLRFFWKVTSELDYDYLSFSMDGQELARISGDVDWKLKSLPIPEGTHHIVFKYRKDSKTEPEIADGAWVDQVSLFPREGLPGSDSFAGAQALTGSFISLHTSNLDATKETEERPLINETFGHSLWWTWAAPETGNVEISTDGSNFDTTLVVYTGSNLLTLQAVAANDNLSKKSKASQVRFKATAGETYYIRVAGVGADVAGLIDLDIHYLSKGTYLGVILPDAGADLRAGQIQLTLSDALAYTGAVTFGGVRYNVRGTLASGSVQQSIPRKGSLTPLDLVLKLDLSHGSTEVTGTLTNAGTPYSFTARRRILTIDLLDYSAGTYTLLLEPATLGSAVAAYGTGYGRATVSKKGDVRFSGFLPDGQKVSQGSALTFGRIWPAYFAPYKGGIGTMAGDVDFDPVAANNFDGSLHWRVENGATTFSDAITLKGTYYFKPASTETVLFVANASPNLQVVFSHQNSTADPASDLSLTLRPPNALTGAPTGYQLKLDVKTGLFSGYLPDPITGKKATFAGALLQSENRGAGLFNSTIGRGRVQIVTPP